MNRSLLLAVATLATPFLIGSVTSEEATPVEQRIVLPISERQYDVRPLDGTLTGKNAGKSDRSIWYPLTSRTQLALRFLQAEGTITHFEITKDHLLLQFAESKRQEIKSALFPPRFSNLDQFHGQHKVAVLVHGLEGGPLTYRDLAPAFERHDWFPLKMVYPNDGGIEVPSDFLLSQLELLHTRYPKTRFVIVAHSLGGLIAWSALSQERASATGVTDLVTLGTPFGGSSMARFQSDLELADVAGQIISGDLSGLNTVADGQGEAIEVLRPDSQLRGELLQRSLNPGVKHHVVAGDKGMIEKNDQPQFKILVEQFVAKRRPAKEFAQELADLAIAPELVIGEGDTAVTVKSATAVTNPTSLKVVHRTHTELLKLNDPDDTVMAWLMDLLDDTGRPMHLGK